LREGGKSSGAALAPCGAEVFEAGEIRGCYSDPIGAEGAGGEMADYSGAEVANDVVVDLALRKMALRKMGLRKMGA
jgi:hypothetical protein